ncbi:MAG: two-component system sensor histidine kinase BaeS [Desulforhopalus sp.]
MLLQKGIDVKLKIRHKLFLALLFTSVVVSLALHLFVKSSFERGFRDYVKQQEVEQIGLLKEELVTYFKKEGSWEFIVDNHVLWQSLPQATSLSSPQMAPARQEIKPPRRPGGRPLGGPPGGLEGGLDRGPRGVGPRISLYDAETNWLIGGAVDSLEELKMYPMELAGETIGYLGLSPDEKLLFARDQHFLKKQAEMFTLIPIVIVLLSLLLSFPMTIHLLRPINAMAEGARKLIAGKFKTRIPITTGDELGSLSKDLNILAMTLEKNEKNRKQWVADVSHELRTPLAILRGEIEALQDGIRQPSTQTFNGLHGEVMHLERMVGDLYELSMSDIGALNYKRILVNPIGIVDSVVEMFQPRMHQKNIEIMADAGEAQECSVLADPDRLQQLFSNILENSLRYTDGPGMIQVHLAVGKDSLKVSFKDSSPGVPDDQLAMLFNRFHRVEGSRNRKTGGVGLGLAICKNIVDGHEGKIKAERSPLGGVLIEIELPLSS